VVVEDKVFHVPFCSAALVLFFIFIAFVIFFSVVPFPSLCSSPALSCFTDDYTIHFSSRLFHVNLQDSTKSRWLLISSWIFLLLSLLFFKSLKIKLSLILKRKIKELLYCKTILCWWICLVLLSMFTAYHRLQGISSITVKFLNPVTIGRAQNIG